MKSEFIITLQKEIERCRELSKRYQDMGPAGACVSAMADAAISSAEKSLELGNPTLMQRALVQLRMCEGLK